MWLPRVARRAENLVRRDVVERHIWARWSCTNTIAPALRSRATTGGGARRHVVAQLDGPAGAADAGDGEAVFDGDRSPCSGPTQTACGGIVGRVRPPTRSIDIEGDDRVDRGVERSMRSR